MHRPPRRPRFVDHLRVAAGLGLCSAFTTPACDSGPPPEGLEPLVEQRLYGGGWQPVDLLLVVDDSASMAQHPHVAESTAEMVRRLVAPPCVDDRGVEVDPPVRAAPGGGCPTGTRAAWAPVRDLNVGVITTSVGAAGRADRCIGDGGAEVGRGDAGAHLMTRWSPDAIDDVETWEGRGFLAWDPEGIRRCGTTPDAYCAGIDDLDTLVARVQTIVQGVGSGGCGDEAPLEAAWRFLGDPAPSLGVDDDGIPFGVDEELLAQRAAFLRPWSRVVVALITDEDDCSFRRDAVGRYGTDPGSPMPRPRAECVDDPASPCCASCIEAAPVGCEGDGGCDMPGCQDPEKCPGNFHATSSENDRQYRCLDPKRRFGLDLLYPVTRYAQGFQSPVVNPTRIDLAADGGPGEVDNLLVLEHEVHLLAIAPVDWQRIARRDAAGTPDLLHGLDPGGSPRGGYRSVGELTEDAAWSELVADVPGNDAPIRLLSVAEHLHGSFGDLSRRSSLGAITPPRLGGEGPRLLDVGFEAAAADLAPSSPCGASFRSGDGSSDALRWKCGHARCMSEPLQVDASGDASCLVVEGYDSDGDGDPATTARCACDPGDLRFDLDDAHARYVHAIRRDEPSGNDCFCAVPRAAGDPDDPSSPRHACLHDPLPGEGVDGWCYLDETAGLGAADLLRSCPLEERQLVRVVGRGEPRLAATLHIGCIPR